MKKSNGIALAIVGGVVSLIGAILLYIGDNMTYDVEKQLKSLFSSGRVDQTGRIVFGIGIGLIVIGVILIIIGIIIAVAGYNLETKNVLSGKYVSYNNLYEVYLSKNGKFRWVQTVNPIQSKKQYYYGKFRRINDSTWQMNVANTLYNIELDGCDIIISNNSFNEKFHFVTPI